MKNDKELHLDEDHICRAVVDAGDLPLPVRRHLEQCFRCRNQIAQLQKDLANLNQMATQVAPLPSRRLNLSHRQKSHPLRWSWSWKIALGASLVAAASIFIFWSKTPEIIFETPGRSNLIAQYESESEKLMTEVNRLSKNALPQVYLDIVSESESGLDEEFVNFMAPSI
ncbi:MAG: hypothetical protein PVI06_04025 [Desulfobacterales bacterium]|jgi:hypothetical protein